MFTRILRQSSRVLPRNLSEETEEEQNYRNLLLNGAWYGPVDGGIFNFFPVFLARMGASASLVGLVTSGPALAGILSYIPGGAYAERQRDLVKLVVRTTFIVRLSYLLIACLPFVLAPAYIPLVAVVLWTVMALPNGISIPAWTTVMQQAISPQKRARLNGTRWALFSLVSGVCIALFGYLLDHAAFPMGYQVVFAISFVAAALNLYYFGKVRVPPFQTGRERTPARSLSLSAFLSPLAESRPFVRFTVATLPWRLAYSLPIALFSIYWVDQLHATDTWIGLRGTVAYAALVVGYRSWGQIAGRVGHRGVLLACGAISGLYPVLTALAPNAPWLLPAALIWGVAVSGTDIGLFDMLLSTCPDGRQPSFAATSNLLVSIVTFAGPLLGSGLAQLAGVRGALLIAGALQLAATAGFMALPGRAEEAAS